MIAIARSEFIRIWRPSFRYGGIGLMAGFAALISVFIFTSLEDSSATATTAAPGPGGAFATAAEIAEPGGFLIPLGTVSDLAGIVLLSLWAIAAASDYESGLIRVLVQAQPNRMKLLTGKIIALTGFTMLATWVTTLTVVLVARPLARLQGIPMDAWPTDAAQLILSGYFNFMVPGVVWGLIGLLIAVWTRSSGIAIASGIGYLLIVESLIGIVLPDIIDYLPGGTLGALAAGGTENLAWSAALGLTVAYGAAAAGAALLIFRQRDIIS